MKHIGNDFAHITIAFILLGLPQYGMYGFALAGLLLGMLAEAKEEHSNILKVSLLDLNIRDILGYVVGALVIGVVTHLLI